MRSRKARHATVALTIGAVGALVLSACGGGGSSFGGATKSQATGPAKLTIMIGSSGDAETNAVKAATDAWAKKSGNTAEVIVASDLGQQLGQGFAGGTPPDLFYADAARIGDFAKAGNLFAYGDQFASANFLPSLVKTFTYKSLMAACAATPKDENGGWTVTRGDVGPSLVPRARV